MEPVVFAEARPVPPPPEWAVTGTAETRHNMLTSLYLEADVAEDHLRKMEARYREAERVETRAECWRTEDAEIVLVGYGIVGRILKAVVELGRARGMKLGMLRPITLFPFPARMLRELSGRAKAFVAVELSTGQMVDDVRLAVEGRRPVEFFSRVGGNVPSAEDVLEFLAAKFHLLAEEALVHG